MAGYSAMITTTATTIRNTPNPCAPSTTRPGRPDTADARHSSSVVWWNVANSWLSCDEISHQISKVRSYNWWRTPAKFVDEQIPCPIIDRQIVMKKKGASSDGHNFYSSGPFIHKFARHSSPVVWLDIANAWIIQPKNNAWQICGWMDPMPNWQVVMSEWEQMEMGASSDNETDKLLSGPAVDCPGNFP